MTTSKTYDDEVERKRREIRGEFPAKAGKHDVTMVYEIKGNEVTLEIVDAPPGSTIGPGETISGIPEVLQPKRRGSPKGSKNKPKVLKSP